MNSHKKTQKTLNEWRKNFFHQEINETTHTAESFEALMLLAKRVSSHKKDGNLGLSDKEGID